MRQKLEIPLLPKNALQLEGQMLPGHRHWGTFFPFRKLKGSHTFMAQSTIVGSIGTEEDLSVKLEGEEEAESSEGRRPRNPKWDWWSKSADQLYCLFCQCSQAVSEEKT